MSIWSKLGLSDAASMAAMKEEILALRQENRALHEAQSKQSQQLHESHIACTHEAAEKIENKISGVGEQLEFLQSVWVSSLRDSQQEILSAENTHKDQVLQQVSVVRENQELLREGISSITASREKSLAQITDLFREIRSLESKASSSLQAQLSELHNACHVISDELAFLRETARVRNGTDEKMIAQLVSGQTELQKILNESQGIAENISFLKEYTESLWEAMKLVWINDLIDDSSV